MTRTGRASTLMSTATGFGFGVGIVAGVVAVEWAAARIVRAEIDAELGPVTPS